MSKKMTIAEKIRANIWDRLDDVVDVVNLSRQRKWSWTRSANCKYIDVRIDMRDGGCIIRDRAGERIGPNRLRWQYSDESPEAPTT